MTDSLERLAQLLPPPAASVTQPPWERSRAEVGFDFPSDYRAFVDRYGGGEFGTSDWSTFKVYAPSSAELKPGKPAGFQGFVDYHVSGTARLFEGCDEDDWGGTVYPMHPQPGGLLTWGENREGDIFWWLTEGDDPDAWPVVMWARSTATTYRFDTGMVEFLHSMVNGDVPGPSWMRSSRNRWTTTHDWLYRALTISAGPGSRAGRA
ncbi:hypothetical protein ACWCQK_18000 [Streptomyces sp. NPDC002306]